MAAVPPVSLIIPTRDRGVLLLDAVRSALDAPTPPAELIVVDDSSTDGSVDAVERLRSPLVRIVRGPFGGAGAARNAGAAVSSQPFLGFLDSDDLMLPGKTTCLVEALERDPSAALVHGTVTVMNENSDADEGATRALGASMAEGRRIGTDFAGLAEHCTMFTSATLIRRDAFDAVDGFDESLAAYEDWDLYLRLSLQWTLVYADCPAARYRVWKGNMGWQRTAEWTARVAEQHLAALPVLLPAKEQQARYGLQRRIALSNHILVRRGAARRAALAAVRLNPLRGLRDRSVQRPLLGSLLPAAVLHRRRP
jgi:glycosyltransferase involved in cell wall biosynthesis